MNCSELEENLLLWASTQAQLENKALSQHLSSCNACANLWNKLTLDLACITQEKKILPPNDLQAKIIKRIENEQRCSIPIPVRRTRNIIYRSTLTAAALLAGLYIGIALGSIYEQSTISQTSELTDDNYFLAVMDYQTIETNFLNADE